MFEMKFQSHSQMEFGNEKKRLEFERVTLRGSDLERERWREGEKKTKGKKQKEKGKEESSETGMREEGVLAQPQKERFFSYPSPTEKNQIRLC